MNLWQRLILARRRLSITTKFNLAFITLLLLIGIVALTSFGSLNDVQSETKAAIDIGIEVQRQVFQMDTALRNARQLERDFFLNWPTIGFTRAFQKYVLTHQSEIEKVKDIRNRLQERIAKENVSAALRQSNPALVNYAEIVEQYSRSFREAVGLVKDLGIENVGLLAKLEQYSVRLRDRFELINAPELMVLYLEMQSFEKEYLSTRQEEKMLSLSESVKRVRKGIIASSKLDTISRAQALKDLDSYESIAKEIVKLYAEILSNISSFDSRAAEVSDKLLGLAKAVCRASTGSHR